MGTDAYTGSGVDAGAHRGVAQERNPEKRKSRSDGPVFSTETQEIDEHPLLAYLPREEWEPFDPTLIADGLFAAGNVFSGVLPVGALDLQTRTKTGRTFLATVRVFEHFHVDMNLGADYLLSSKVQLTINCERVKLHCFTLVSEAPAEESQAQTSSNESTLSDQLDGDLSA
ncbi:hypothetical protein HPB51_013047 [Rhipicephalus microplus]|uniref:Uncharacterized protein n=1 Tax=Rhipicephalus microplus TaxID=6941 RepID=A0A9J6F3U9_RHIMP|nr:hypothetical protein HPB51_013047 [Rhipicephalus microplus]